MSDVADAPNGLTRPRREVAMPPPAKLENFEIAETSILASLSESRR